MPKPDTYYRDNTLQGEKFIDYYKDKPRPTPGYHYTVVAGDDFVKISIGAYGSTKDTWNVIRANDILIKGRKKDSWGAPLLYPGDRVFIPGVPAEIKPEPTEIESSDPYEIAIRLDGIIYRGWTANTIFRAINTIADGFNFSAPYDENDFNSRILDPFTYYTADLFIGGKLYISGRAEKWRPQSDENSTTMTIECRSRSGVLVDCPSQNRALNFKNQSLKQIAELLIKPFGLSAEFPADYNNAIIPKTKRGITDKVADYLQSLAKSIGMIINGSITGGLKFETANVNGTPILTLRQGEYPLLSVDADYDGTQRFSDYEAISQTNGQASNRILEQDKSVKFFRPTIFDAKDATQGNIKNAAKWEKSRALSRAAKVSAVIGTWYDKNNNLIFENNIITLYYPKVCIFKETRFLIEKVTFTKDAGKNITTLELVQPESYTLEFPKIFWWAR